jgi:hypothetical protein
VVVDARVGAVQQGERADDHDEEQNDECHAPIVGSATD